ncbi:MAG: SUMF1/EgtB/PvdO family nonheme iron enzyme [Polyangiaceae bacterium]
MSDARSRYLVLGLPAALFAMMHCGHEEFGTGADASADSDGNPLDASVSDAPVGDALAEAGARSCLGLGPVCGPTHASDCCDSPLVPGGTYNRLNDPIYPATVSPFRLDRFEVTVGRFRRYVDALPSADGDILRAQLKCPSTTWLDTPGKSEQFPVNCVVRADAIAFCAWDNGRLTTEAEWNFAAAGGDEQRVFPWSVPPKSHMFNQSYAVYSEVTSFDGGISAATGVLAEVGTKPLGAGKWGHYDLSGNAIEIMRDDDGTFPVPCLDCWNDSGPPGRLEHRGGSYATPGISNTDGGGIYLSNGFRDGDPDARGSAQGFRCAREP